MINLFNQMFQILWSIIKILYPLLAGVGLVTLWKMMVLGHRLAPPGDTERTT